MSSSIVKYIGSQPVLQIIKSLLTSPEPRHLRDLASQHSYSPAGVSDILRRLSETGALNEIRQGNKRCFSLNLSEEETRCLFQFFSVFERTILEERASRFSLDAAKNLEWMDEAYQFYRDLKKREERIHNMTPLRILKQAVAVLEELDCRYCLIGGHAASLYRSQERLTKDVDFAIVASPVSKSRKSAEKAIQLLGLKPMVGFFPHSSKEKLKTKVCMVTSQPGPNEKKGIIDILLPELPWLIQAVERAQYNRIDLGFAMVPVISPEDLILAECYALHNDPDRFQDLDDLKEIFQNVPDLDQDYISLNLRRLELSIPTPVRKYARSTI